MANSAKTECMLDAQAILARYQANRARTAQLFELVRHALYERPLPLRMPFVFYLGHIPGFSYSTLARAFGEAPLNAGLEELFRRGIDPPSADAAAELQPQTWPDLPAVELFAAQVDAVVSRWILEKQLVDSEHPMLKNGDAFWTILEHEEMHQETLLYLITCLNDEKKTPGRHRLHAQTENPRSSVRCHIPAGIATLGAPRETTIFAWDNEFDEHYVHVPAFTVDSLPVSNREYLASVRTGAAPPMHWFEREGEWWLKTIAGAIPLPLDWPVYVSPSEAFSYAAARGARVMSEAEYHRAAFATPDNGERPYPWGTDAPTSQHGNFDFARLAPVNRGSSPAGASAWGVEELVGNGWEMTSTPFRAFSGFRPSASYPEYSQDFFDSQHVVIKGASPVTPSALIRRSFRNWFFRDYPYAFLKFRLVYEE